MRISRLNVFIVSLLLAAGCVHKISIPQGNYLTDDTIAKVEEGMTRDQVRFLLGTPLADDPFSKDRWDYVYHFRNGRTGEVTRKRLSVHFQGDTVARIEDSNS